MESDSPWLFLVLLLLIILSAIFSMSETALTSMSKIRLRTMVDDNVKNANIISRLVDNPNKLLSSILIGNNLVNILASSIATSVAMSYDPVAGIGIATALMTIVVLIFGEITPKTLAAQNAEKISILVAKFISAVVFVMTPAVVVLNVATGKLIKILGGNKSSSAPTITEAELKTIVNVSHEEGVLEGSEKQMINNVFDFGDFKAKDVMLPRTDIVAVNLNMDYDDIAKVFKDERLSRIPVYNEDIDDVVGILYLKEFAFVSKENFNIKDCMIEPFFTYESKNAMQLFYHMRSEKVHIAIVLDEYGGTSGLISIEDLVEEIVGNIYDEFEDMEDEFQKIHENEFIIDGSARLEDVNEMLSTKFESDEADTIAGYVIDNLGHIPKTGEILDIENVKILVEETDKNRIVKLRVTIHS